MSQEKMCIRDRNPNYSGLKAYSIILLEQIRTIDRSRLKEYIGHLESEIMILVDGAIAVSLGLV